MNKSVILPQWLDDIIFKELEAVYEPRPEEVMINPDKDFDFAKLYLGTYFPRSYAEAYCILGRLLDNKNYYQVLDDYTELNILDFCCGTGGEIFGLISILHERLPNLKSIRVDAFDANSEYVRFLFHLGEKMKENISISVSINPQCYHIKTEQHLQDIVNYTNTLYHIVLSCKALNEFIQHDVFPNENIYEKIARVFLPCLDAKGLFLLSDLSHKDKKKGVFYPEIMNKGFNSLIRSDNSYKSIYPYPCFFHEHNCPGCYMQDIVYVSHSRREKDTSKIAYRIIGEVTFVEKLMSGISTQQICRANFQNADKSIPYQSK
ncbi:MAG: hypothetical protein IJS63_11875 [Bacteroidaceae bacterium]|nr:hypothetical protein [Bacteroidaceae bacterium]